MYLVAAAERRIKARRGYGGKQASPGDTVVGAVSRSFPCKRRPKLRSPVGKVLVDRSDPVVVAIAGNAAAAAADSLAGWVRLVITVPAS